ncbi:hypothetical protein FN846DRAFT_908708 [Sphaerosporella brunnea]|uniref:Uncharacterized protein n=1 Tax=Sphaerosporella brunnea TaxID=1250544 RepID=A0A5J5ESZ0_9PEZI|nr:hypothetical protein FN846DRAFT_908708 [Sphaerosporella brunnea]
MAHTCATNAPAAQITAFIADEDEVDYSDDPDLTDVSELRRQLLGTANEPTSGHPTQSPEPVLQISSTPAPAYTPGPAHVGDNAVVTVPMALFTTMTNTMNALTTHLDMLQVSRSAQAQLAQVDPVHLQEILDLHFKVENLLKLNASFLYISDRRLENITLGSSQTPTTARNVEIEEYRGITQLLKPLAVYADILREFDPPGIRDALSSALFKVLQGVYDYGGWHKCSDSELNHLLEARTATSIQARGLKRPAENAAFGLPAKRPTRTAVPSDSPPRVPSTCRRYNRGLCVAG